MYQDAVASLPAWFVWGVVLGLLASLGAAGVFLVGTRAFPEAGRDGGTDRRSGDERRRDEIREYLTAIGEEFVEDDRVEGQGVAFYLPERDVAITFDPRAFYRVDGTGTHAVLAEHEMPGVNLGYRLPFETPDLAGATPGAAADRREHPGRDPEAALAALGLSAGATPEEVQSAYREKVKQAHPDQGGDEEEFRRVREAYAAAKRRTRTRTSGTGRTERTRPRP